MPAARLTSKQRSLIKELDDVASELRLFYRSIETYKGEDRVTQLQRIMRHFVIGEVVMQYTLIDEYFNVRLATYFFGSAAAFPRLWRTKRFRNFNYFVLEPLSLVEKMRFARAIKPVPKAIAADVERLNDLRNRLAHAFFPENLRAGKPAWKGNYIFSRDGVAALVNDMAALSRYFRRWVPRV